MCKALSLLLLFWLSIGSVSAQSAWELATEEDGVKVFISDIKGSKVKALKVECELNARLDAVVALLMDIPGTDKWLSHIKSCIVLRNISATELYAYTETSLPWPLANRDYVTHLQVFQNPQSKLVTVDGPAVPGMVATKKDVIRIPHSKSTWSLLPITAGRIKLEYQLHVDPLGSIPSSLVNYFATGASIETIKSMKAILQTPKYKNADLPFISG